MWVPRIVQADVRTVVGNLYLDGDADDNSTTDHPNGIDFANQLNIVAKQLLTLESTHGTLVPPTTSAAHGGTRRTHTLGQS